MKPNYKTARHIAVAIQDLPVGGTRCLLNAVVRRESKHEWSFIYAGKFGPHVHGTPERLAVNLRKYVGKDERGEL